MRTTTCPLFAALWLLAPASQAATGELPLPHWTVSVVPDGPDAGFDRMVNALLNYYLSEAGFEVLESPGAIDLAAVAAGADSHVFRIHFKGLWELEGDGGRYTLDLRVVHPTTGRLVTIIKEIGRTEDEVKPTAIKAALEATLPKLFDRLRAEQRREVELGRETLVIFREPPPNSEAALRGLLKPTCGYVKAHATEERELSFTARCKLDPAKLAKRIEAGLKKSFPGYEIERTAELRYQLTFAFPYTPARKQ